MARPGAAHGAPARVAGVSDGVEQLVEARAHRGTTTTLGATLDAYAS